MGSCGSHTRLGHSALAIALVTSSCGSRVYDAQSYERPDGQYTAIVRYMEAWMARTETLILRARTGLTTAVTAPGLYAFVSVAWKREGSAWVLEVRGKRLYNEPDQRIGVLDDNVIRYTMSDAFKRK